MMEFVAVVGRAIQAILTATKCLYVLTRTKAMHCVRPPVYSQLILHQMIEIGYHSFPVIRLTAGR